MTRFLSALPLLLALSSAHAAVVPRLAFEQLVADSPRIVHALVVDSQVASSGEFLWTHYRLQVLDEVKGVVPAVITVSEPGATLNGISMQVSGAIVFRAGEEVVLFLYQTPLGYWRLRGSSQGKVDVADSPSGKRIRTASNQTLTDFLAAIRREASK